MVALRGSLGMFSRLQAGPDHFCSSGVSAGVGFRVDAWSDGRLLDSGGEGEGAWKATMGRFSKTQSRLRVEQLLQTGRLSSHCTLLDCLEGAFLRVHCHMRFVASENLP